MIFTRISSLILFIAALLYCSMASAGATVLTTLPSLAMPPHAKPLVERTAANAAALKELFNKELFSLQQTRESGLTPQVYVDHIPQDLDSLTIKEMKQLFIQLILPGVLKVNAHIEEQRKAVRHILDKRKQGKTVSENEMQWMEELHQYYSVIPDGPETLLTRMDTIPPSLAITQAIIESGWGRSRFAKQGNVLFGLHLPKNSNLDFIKASGANIKLAVFGSIIESVEAYIHNINTTRAYRKLRKIRLNIRNKSEQPDGWNLSAGLANYSELGEKYISKLRSIIKFNNLAPFDKAKLIHDKKSYFVKVPR